jgi:hypothetical protein
VSPCSVEHSVAMRLARRTRHCAPYGILAVRATEMGAGIRRPEAFAAGRVGAPPARSLRPPTPPGGILPPPTVRRQARSPAPGRPEAGEPAAQAAIPAASSSAPYLYGRHPRPVNGYGTASTPGVGGHAAGGRSSSTSMPPRPSGSCRSCRCASRAAASRARCSGDVALTAGGGGRKLDMTRASLGQGSRGRGVSRTAGPNLFSGRHGAGWY